MERPKRSFSFNRRPTKQKNKYIYYVRFRDESGEYLSAISTGKTNKAAAEIWAYEFLAKGLSPDKRSTTFESYVEGFWDYETSRYIQGRLARGFSFARKYADICRGNTKNHLIPEFGKRKLKDITTKEIDAWIMSLYAKGEISPTTVNKLLTLLRVILEEAKKEGYIGSNPTEAVERVKMAPVERSILSGEEVQKLFAPGALKSVWNNKRKYMVMNLLAAATGMRQGEIRGLQLQFIHEDYIEVKLSWEERYGLKEPKNGSTRIIPIPSKVSSELQKLISLSPYKNPEDLLFYGRDSSHPIDKKMVQRTFNRALSKIDIDEDEKRERNVTFHSWRHFFNTLCRVGKVPDSKLQRLTGHKTQAMTEHYTHYRQDDYKDVMKVQERIFSPI